MSVEYIPPQTPLLYSKTGVCRDISNFLLFDPKHTLWVLVRTPSPRRFYRVPTMHVLSENVEKVKIFPMKISIFSSEKNIFMGMFSDEIL